MAERAISVLSGWAFQSSKRNCAEEQCDYRPEKETQPRRHVVGGLTGEEDVKILLLSFRDGFVISSNYSMCAIMSLRPQFHKHTQTEHAIQNNCSMKKEGPNSPNYLSEKNINIKLLERKRGKQIISPQVEDSPNLVAKQFFLNLRMTTQHKISWKTELFFVIKIPTFSTYECFKFEVSIQSKWCNSFPGHTDPFFCINMNWL